MYASGRFDLAGTPIDEATWNANVDRWLPSAADKAYVKSLMVPCFEKGKTAGWIAPPAKGIQGLPVDYEYVRL